MRILDSVDSTNAYVKQAWEALPHGEAVLARTQTAGRGRLGRCWDSSDRGMFLSVYLKTVPGLLPFRAALAARDCLPDITMLKWPNDLLFPRPGDRYAKLGGILCEGFVGGAVVGIGINLCFGGEPPTPHAACYAEHAPPPLPEMLAAQIQARLLDWLSPADEAVIAAYIPRCVTLGRAVTLPDGRTARAVGVDVEGRLLAETEGEKVPVFAGEVSVERIY